jgi:hypothetical protein
MSEYNRRYQAWSQQEWRRKHAEQEAREPKSWQAANALLTGRCHDSRKVARNTYLKRRSNGDIAVMLHSTDVVTFHMDGTFTLSMGGWPTMTTRDRIDRFTPKWLRMYSERGVQKVRVNMKGQGWGEGVTYRHFDGITFGPRGGCKNPLPTETTRKLDSEKDKLDMAIKRYADGFVKAARNGEVAMPSGGDCWYCSMRVVGGEDDGKPLGDVANSDHLLQHFEDKYYVPSLMVNAMRAKGYGDTGIYMWMNMDPENDRIGGDKYGRPWDAKTAKAALVAYLRKHLLTGISTGRMANH